MQRLKTGTFYRRSWSLCRFRAAALWLATAVCAGLSGCAPRPFVGDKGLEIRQAGGRSIAMIDLGAVRLQSDAYQAAIATEFGLLGVDIHENPPPGKPWGEIRVVHLDARVMRIEVFGQPDDGQPDRVEARLGYTGDAEAETRYLRALSAKAMRPPPRRYRGHFELPAMPE